jgi:hypothetical protein
MKLNRLETHDRYEHFTKQSFDIGECCQDLINQRPFGDHPFYIFAHTRTDEDGVTKRLIWQPRLTKPKAQSNSMLFKAYPGTDLIKVLWMIPDRALWNQYGKGLITENKTVSESIRDFQFNRNKLEEKEEDDMSEEQINAVYKEISFNARKKQSENKLLDHVEVEM